MQVNTAYCRCCKTVVGRKLYLEARKDPDWSAEALRQHRCKDQDRVAGGRNRKEKAKSRQRRRTKKAIQGTIIQAVKRATGNATIIGERGPEAIVKP